MNNTKLSAICDAIAKYDASFEEAKHPRDKSGKFGRVTSVGGERLIETKPNSGEWKPLGKHSVHKWTEEDKTASFANMVHHTNNEKAANKKAHQLWEKTGEPHYTAHTEYLR